MSSLATYPTILPTTMFRRLATDAGRQVGLFSSPKLDRVSLNESAEQVIIRCDGTRTITDIALELAALYDKTPVNTIAGRIEQILTPLIESGYVEQTVIPRSTPRLMPLPLAIPLPLNNLFFELTYACNLNCVHCYLQAVREDQDILSFTQITSIIDQFSAAGGLELNLSGGEPLLRPDLVEIIAYAAAKPLVVRLLSNGILITADLAQRLKQAGLAGIQLSLDGHCAAVHDAYRGLPGAFDRTIDAIGHLQEAGLKVDINTVINRSNIDHIFNIIKLGMRHDIVPVFSRQRPDGRALTIGRHYQISHQEYAQAIIRINHFHTANGQTPFRETKCKPERYRCLAGTGGLSVRPNGDVVPCANFRQSGEVLGNVASEDIIDIWKSRHPLLVLLRATDLNVIKLCNGCKHFTFCSGGCPAEAFKIWGDYTWPDIEKCAYVAQAEPFLELVEASAGPERTRITCDS